VAQIARVFLTGGTGFIGSWLAAALRHRGDEVVALVRSPARAAALRELGCNLVEGDLADAQAIRRGLEGCDAAVHTAGDYRIGITAAEAVRMRDVNVGGTERVLDAATEAGVGRIVYVSTVNVFGNTRGRVVDETYERQLNDGFLSAYDETKHAAHQVAVERAGRGAPVIVAQPGAVYGPGDESQLGEQLRLAQRGKLRYVTFGGVGFTAVHVDDIAAGLMLVLDRGRLGESYVLGGEPTTMKRAVAIAARTAGKKPPKLAMPTAIVRMMVPFGRVIGPLLGQPPNLRELVRASDGVTYWATHAKAERELGYAPRDLETGLRETAARTGPT
jgi:nucleoside-diphosphate-sugar epimerase